MKHTAKAGEYLDSPDYQARCEYDVRYHEGLVVLLMNSLPAVVTQAQWEKACATLITWDDDWEYAEEEVLDVWNALMKHDLSEKPRGKKAIKAVLAE